MKYVLTAAAGGLALLLVGSFLGALHPAGDSLAVFRLQIAAAVFAMAAILVLAGLSRRAFALCAFGLLSLASITPHAFGPRNMSDFRLAIYQKNLNFRLADPMPIAEDILSTAADFVTLQEVHPWNEAILASLAPAFPTRVACSFSAVGGPVLLSRLPARPDSARCLDGAAMATLETPCGPVRVISIHLHWPWPFEQGSQVDALLEDLDNDLPTIVAGDFNMVQWSHAVRAIGRATGTRPLNSSRNTLPGKIYGLGLAIDHILAPRRHGTVELRPRLGSDHRGLYSLLPCP